MQSQSHHPIDNRQLAQYGFTLLALVYIICTRFIPVKTKMQFYEQDISLSYIAMDEQVPTTVMMIISILAPASFILLNFAATVVTKAKIDRFNLVSIFYLILGLAQTLIFTMGITDTFKFLTGRPRPIFLYQCDYQFFRTNRTHYYNTTSPAALGDYSNYKSSTADFYESVKSFPSGHASTSFAGMMYTMYLIRLSFARINSAGNDVYKFNDVYRFNEVDNSCSSYFRNLLSYFPLFIAGWISTTRVHDMRHHVEDVIAGALIGCGVAHCIWRSTSSLIRGWQRNNLNTLPTQGNNLSSQGNNLSSQGNSLLTQGNNLLTESLLPY